MRGFQRGFAVSAVLAVLVLAVFAGTAAAVKGHHSKRHATEVSATEVEFGIKLSRSSAPAGRVTFVVKNEGKLAHQFIVLRTDRPASRLPVHGSVVALDKAGHVLGDVRVSAGKTARLTLDLRAGRYVVLCNLPAHYRSGQHAAFKVT